MLGHYVSRAATDLSLIERPSLMKIVTTENNWTFELGVGGGINIPFYVIIRFVQRDQFNQQHQENDRFYRPSVLNAQCFTGSQKHPSAEISCNSAIDKYSQAYGEIVSCFRLLVKDNVL